MQTQRLVLLFVLSLAACTPNFEPEKVDFRSDPRILRGEWMGEAVLDYPITPLVYSPDGSLLFYKKAAINAIYNVETLETVATLDDESIGAAQFSLDGKTLTTIGGDKESLASLWDTTTGERLKTFPIEEDFVSFSQDLTRFATKRDLEEGAEIAIHDVNSGQFLYSFIVPLYNRYARVEVSPDLSTAITFERRGGYTESLTFKAWDVESGESLLEFPLDPELTNYRSLFSPDSSLLAITYGSFTRIWDVTTGTFLPNLGEEVGVPLAFSGNASRLVTKANRYVRFWDVQMGIKLKEIEFMVVEPDSSTTKQVISPELNQIVQGEEGKLKIADLDTGEILREITLSEPLPFQLSLEAIYINETSYDVSGTLQYGDGTYTIQGEVEGAGEEVYLKPTRSRPEAYFNLEALGANGEIDWVLNGSAPDNETYGNSPSLDDIWLEGDIERPSKEGFSRSFSLKRQP